MAVETEAVTEVDAAVVVVDILNGKSRKFPTLYLSIVEIEPLKTSTEQWVAT